MLSMVNAVVENDFSRLSVRSLEVGMLAGEKLENVTAELKRANNDIFRTPTAKTEYGVLARFRRLLHHGSAVKDNVLESNGYLYGADHGG